MNKHTIAIGCLGMALLFIPASFIVNDFAASELLKVFSVLFLLFGIKQLNDSNIINDL